MPAHVKYQGPTRAFIRGWASTRLTTVASRPIPQAKTKWRPLMRPRSMRRGRKSSAIPIRCSVASTTSLGIPSVRQTTLVDPPGSTEPGTSVPARPLATSFSVPSPPKATTMSYSPLRASRPISIACSEASVSTASTS